MKNGNIITIIPSIALNEMRLDKLAGRSAKVVEIRYDSSYNIKGCWVSLNGEPYEGEQEWYIPYSSIIE